MAATVQSRTHPRRRLGRLPSHLLIESLEARCLPSVTGWPGLLGPVLDAEGNSTLDLAQDLGNLSITGRGEAAGTIGDSPEGAADVDWYTFSLDAPALVTLTTLNQDGGSEQRSVLSLYNRDADNFADLFNPTFHRLLAQEEADSSGEEAELQRPLAAGTYFVAVSGSGNTHFHPFLADSGSEGSTGDYGVLLTALDLGLDPADGPVVLASDPSATSLLDAAPFLLRVNLSTPLDANTVVVDQTVQLLFHATGTFGDGNEVPIGLAAVNLSTAGDELQIQPASILEPGYYQLVLAGDSTAWPMVLLDLNGTPLGQSAANPTGQDYALLFEIQGSEGGVTADDTPLAAQDLGPLTAGTFLRRAGAVGDDPAYNTSHVDPLLANPAADVDMYRFQITEAGNYTFIAEVFAGRIGSPLDPGLTLFRVNTLDGSLQLVQANDSTLNDSAATNGMVPLFTDAVLYAGLTAGEYVLAVSGTTNLPDPAAGIDVGTNGVFDPATSHSGFSGFTTGPYVLNLRLHADETAPAVDSATLAEGAELTASPTQFRVTFSEPVNLQQLGFLASQQTQVPELASVYILGSDSVQYHPRLLSYDAATNEAVFLMLDPLPNGIQELHLSGAQGLTDLAGNPLTGNDSSGDYVIRFTVASPARGSTSNPLLWIGQEPNNALAEATVVGTLFPHEVAQGVTFERDFTSDPANAPVDSADFYRFEVLQARSYFFTLARTNLPAGTRPQFFTEAGNAIFTLNMAGGIQLVNLEAGTYVARIGGWTTAQAPSVTYTLRITLGASQENPTPLTVGPAPAYRIRLVTSVASPPTNNNDPPPAGENSGNNSNGNNAPPAGENNNTTPPAGENNNTTPPAGDNLGASPPVGNNNLPPASENPPPLGNVTPPITVELPENPTPAPVPVVVTPLLTPVETIAPAPSGATLIPTPTLSPEPVVSVSPELTPVNPSPIVHTQLLHLELPTPAVAPVPFTPATGATGTTQVSVATLVPGDVLAGLRGGPVGGVASPTPSIPTGEVLTFRPPQLPVGNALAQVMVLTQAANELPGSSGSAALDSEQATSPSMILPPAATGSVSPLRIRSESPPSLTLQQLLKLAVDTLFRNGMPESTDEPTTNGVPGTAPTGSPVPAQNSDEKPEEISAASSSGEFAPELAWLGAGIGLFLPAALERKKTPEQAAEEEAKKDTTTLRV